MPEQRKNGPCEPSLPMRLGCEKDIYGQNNHGQCSKHVETNAEPEPSGIVAMPFRYSVSAPAPCGFAVT